MRFFRTKLLILTLSVFIGGGISLLQAQPLSSSNSECGVDCSEEKNPAPLPTELSSNEGPTENAELHINVPAARLDLYVQGEYVKSYPIAVGMPAYPTPIRPLNITQIIWNPWWLPPDSPWAAGAAKTPPGPNNMLGPVKMMMEDGVRIHGTNNPASIGHSASHACIRMRNADVTELAWTLQTRYSDKTDEALRSKYAKNRSQSYFVNLKAPIPVIVEYKQVERKDDRLLVHPNRYSRKGFEEELHEELQDYPELLSDPKLLAKLEKNRTRKTLEIPISELASWEPTPAPAAKKSPAAKKIGTKSLANAGEAHN